MTTVTEQVLAQLAGVITGAGSGIGEVVAKQLASHGMTVALVGRRQAQLERVQASIEQDGGQAIVVPCDVRDPEAVAELRRTVLRQLGTPQLIFNGAGLHCELVGIADSEPGEWLTTFEVNTFGPYLICQAFLKDMLSSGWGRIINVSSAASLAEPGFIGSAYQLSKVSLNWFTRQLAAELEGTGVTANVIHPGEVKTEMWAAIESEATSRQGEGRSMLNWTQWVAETGGDPPEKTADLVISLLDRRADDTNGQFLWIRDGLKPPMPSW